MDMEGLKRVVREVMGVECSGTGTLIAAFREYTLTVTVDLSTKTMSVVSARPMQMSEKDGARKAQQVSMFFLPGVVVYDDNSFKLLTSTVFLGPEQAEEMLQAMLEVHRERVEAMYQKFIGA